MIFFSSAIAFLLFNNLFGVSDGFQDIPSSEVTSDLELFPIPVEDRSMYKPQAEKRFPQHLDPTLMKFWIQIGG